MIDTLLFDLDDTLVAFDAVSTASWRQACLPLFRKARGVTLEAVCETIQKHSSVYWDDAERARRGRQEIRSARRTIVSSAFDELRLPRQEAIEVADRFSRLRIDNMYILPSTVETLVRFQRQGLKMGLITNGDSAGQRSKIARFGLERFFTLILIEGELGFGKPDRRVYLEALRHLRSSPEASLMTGDNLVWDVEGAQAAGIRGVWYNWRGGDLPPTVPTPPFAVVTDLSQLIDLVGLD